MASSPRELPSWGGYIRVRRLRKFWYRIDLSPDIDIDIGRLSRHIEDSIAERLGRDILKKDEIARLLDERLLDRVIYYVFTPRTKAAKRLYSQLMSVAVLLGKEESKMSHWSHFTGRYEPLPIPGDEWNPYLRRFFHRGMVVGFRIPRTLRWLRFISWFFGSRPHVIPPGAIIPKPPQPGMKVKERYPAVWFRAKRPIMHPGTKDDPGHQYVMKHFVDLVVQHAPELLRKNRVGMYRWMSEAEEELVDEAAQVFDRISDLIDQDILKKLDRFVSY